MSRRGEGLGIFGALAVVLILLGLIALLANCLGILPSH
jgi:hypothetical protein